MYFFFFFFFLSCPCNIQVFLLLSCLVYIAYLREAPMDMNTLQQNNSIAWRISKMLMAYFVLCCVASRFAVLF